MGSKLKSLKASLADFSPRVLKTNLFAHGMDYPDGYKLPKRYIFDYELEFFLDSRGSMFIDDIEYPIRKGDIVFRKPGQTTQGIMPYNCYAVFFDLLGITCKDPVSYDIYSQQEFQTYCSNEVIESIPPVFHPASAENYHHLFDCILKEYINPGVCSDLLLKSYILQLIYHIYTDVSNPLSNASVPLSSHYVTIKRVVEYIKKNIHNELNLKILSEVAGLSPNHFHKVFTDTLNITPNAYIIKSRLDRAKELLAKTSLAIAEIALKCGFENTPYFSYLFKKEVGVSPVKFRRMHSYI